MEPSKWMQQGFTRLQKLLCEAWSKRWGRSFDVTLHPNKLKEVKKIPSGSKVFVNSMSDLFHEKVPTEFINQVFKAIESRPDVIFQVLTKRPEEIHLRMSELISIPKNVWLGVSVEMRDYVGRKLICFAVFLEMRLNSLKENLLGMFLENMLFH